MNVFINRVIRAMRLEANLYEEVEADREAMKQAVAVVILASVAGGIGAEGMGGLRGMVFGSLTALAGWVVWAFLIFFVGTKILPAPETRSNPGELMRTLGFAYSPALLNVFGIIPFLGWLVRLAVNFWLLFAWVVAVRQALDYKSTGRAVAVCVIGWLISVVFMGLIYILVKGMPHLPKPPVM
ncbi:MAG TPA: YIP1 family protein [archaeon]|nr:YIP1 family protein [archaeon]